MGTLYRGDTIPDAIYRGATTVDAVYRGAEKVWPPPPLPDDYYGYMWLSGTGWSEAGPGEANTRVKRLIVNNADHVGKGPPPWGVGDRIEVADSTGALLYTMSAIAQVDTTDPDRTRYRFSNENAGGEGGYITSLTPGLYGFRARTLANYIGRLGALYHYGLRDTTDLSDRMGNGPDMIMGGSVIDGTDGKGYGAVQQGAANGYLQAVGLNTRAAMAVPYPQSTIIRCVQFSTARDDVAALGDPDNDNGSTQVYADGTPSIGAKIRMKGVSSGKRPFGVIVPDGTVPALLIQENNQDALAGEGASRAYVNGEWSHPFEDGRGWEARSTRWENNWYDATVFRSNADVTGVLMHDLAFIPRLLTADEIATLQALFDQGA